MSSTHAATVTGSLPATAPAGIAALATKALTIGAIGIGLTIAGLFVSGGAKVAYSWLVGLTFWTGIAIGMLFLVMIHHIVDASWSTVIRRQFEHGLAAFKWLVKDAQPGDSLFLHYSGHGSQVGVCVVIQHVNMHWPWLCSY